MIKNVLFDLDGTITDPAIGITNSVIYALKKYGMEIPERSALYKFIGPPLAASFSEHCGFSREEGFRAVEIYREYFSTKGIYENNVYPGIEEMLKFLKDNGIGVYLATSKPEVFAKKILKHFGLERYFDDAVGSELNGERVEKADVIECVLARHNLRDAIMVGDRSYDICGAKKNGIPSVGVLYGYGSRKEFEDAGTDYIAETVEELQKLLRLKSGI